MTDLIRAKRMKTRCAKLMIVANPLSSSAQRKSTVGVRGPTARTTVDKPTIDKSNSFSAGAAARRRNTWTFAASAPTTSYQPNASSSLSVPSSAFSFSESAYASYTWRYWQCLVSAPSWKIKPATTTAFVEHSTTCGTTSVFMIRKKIRGLVKTAITTTTILRRIERL